MTELIVPQLEQAYKRWAAQRLNIPLEAIKRVDFEPFTGGYCETCEYVTFGAWVQLQNGKSRTIEESATTIIEEIFELVGDAS